MGDQRVRARHRAGTAAAERPPVLERAAAILLLPAVLILVAVWVLHVAQS